MGSGIAGAVASWAANMRSHTQPDKVEQAACTIHDSCGRHGVIGR